jgi:hypothetical protein
MVAYRFYAAKRIWQQPNICQRTLNYLLGTNITNNLLNYNRKKAKSRIFAPKTPQNRTYFAAPSSTR